MGTEVDSGSGENVTSCRSRACCPLQGRRGWITWTILFLVLVYLQWPMLKGMYYKNAGAVPVSAVAWRSDYASALSEAAQSGKPVLIDFSAKWCPPCNVMKHEVWADPEVGQAVSARFVPLLVDMDLPHNAAVSRRYGVESIPTLLVVNSNGQVLRQASFMTKEELLKFTKGNS